MLIQPTSPASKALVVGTYPPIPRPSADVTVEAVRTAWAHGYEVTVASPRLSAADLCVPIAGLLAGRRLRNTRRHTGADRLVLVVEEGFPLADRRPSGLRVPAVIVWLAAYLLRSAIREFDHVTVIQAGDCSHRATALALSGVDELVRRDVARPPVEVTVLGPPEMTPMDEARRVADRAMRQALGNSAPAVYARARRVRHRLRRR